MNQAKEYEKILEELKKQLPEVDKFMEQITSKFAPFIVDYLREQSKNNLKSLADILNFRLRLVIDNNILFAEIKGLIKGGKDVENCFFYQLALNKSVDFYAPPFLKQEILEKVEEKFSAEDKPKAKQFAEKLLSTITIKEAEWVEDWVKAKRKIGHRDLDDIPYLALCFDLNSHGIMSNDKIFVEEQTDAKVWTINKTGKISAQYNKGMVSFFFIGNIPNVISLIRNLISAASLAILNFIKNTVKIITGVIKEGVIFLSNLPKEIWALGIGTFLIAYINSEEFRNSVGNSMTKLKDYLVRLIKRLRLWLEKFLDFIASILESLKPLATSTAAYLIYLIGSGMAIMEEIKQIESSQTGL
jgi:predicted nucleic acid-binding protein